MHFPSKLITRLCVAFQFVPQAGLTWNILGFPPVDLVGHLSRCLSVPARHGDFTQDLLTELSQVTKPGQSRLPACHT